MQDLKTLIKNLFEAVIEGPVHEEKIIQRYFSTDYVQHVDGKVLDYATFVAHMQALKAATQQLKVTFKALAEEGDTVFTNHEVIAEKKDGSSSRSQVIAEFRVRDGKVYYCDELTHLISGDATDRDLGSRH
ncbi:nuclear transport factor 2 family protein [Chitinophaga pendula]|uniref:nuclear transport factor 2 family protein n=1 Tax=Chitinophaga TaxID=79328 RepID=UPI000BAFFA01|nr:MULTISPECIES: nuclear transport factor 2 family protein [Chitinophaga]ASZ14967.1 hypothetical protein CK934_15750 [Chitinophaga sp. MD30]UCJ10098.1 nuclear transport factor 2 family protein [Chitinophaga pendula]